MRIGTFCCDSTAWGVDVRPIGFRLKSTRSAWNRRSIWRANSCDESGAGGVLDAFQRRKEASIGFGADRLRRLSVELMIKRVNLISLAAVLLSLACGIARHRAAAWG